MEHGNPVLLKLWGVRGSTPTPVRANLGFGGNTSCLEIRAADDRVIILDAGTGIRLLGGALMSEFQGRPLKVDIFLTHYHWDHIQGLPFFAPLYRGDTEVTLHAAGKLGSIHDRLRGQMSAPYFPVDFDSASACIRFVELDASPIDVAGLRISCFPMHHPQGAFGYRLESGHGVAVYASDLEPGNTDLDRVVREYAESADTLIYDSQFTPEEYLTHKGWGHSHWREAVSVASDARVKQLVLFHHDPSHDDPAVERIESDTRRLFESTLAAREGWSVVLARR
jgi:phosphoribosyl 1,2-cyclic phosphodiesterase